MIANGATLEAEQLSCERGEQVLFEAVSFRLKPGELLKVEGPNGAGKTSLLRLLAGLGLPAAGTVYWRGRPIREVSAGYHEQLAFLGHLSGVKGGLTTLENLTAQARLRGADAAAVDVALVQVGLGERCDLPGRSLSAGQKQRLAFARLLLSHARLWILDEPFTALDVSGIVLAEQVLTDHLQRGGLAVVTSHQPLRVAGRTMRLEAYAPVADTA